MGGIERLLVERIQDRRDGWSIFLRFVDVLRTGVAIVDANGHMLLCPDKKQFGCRLLFDSALHCNLRYGVAGFMDHFQPRDFYREAVGRYGVHLYSVPIVVNGNPAAHIILGPFLIHKRHERHEYDHQARQYGAHSDDVFDEIQAARVISNVMVHSIVELFSSIVDVVLPVSLQEMNSRVAQERDLRQRTMVESVLHAAMQMTGAECGSVMLADEQAGELVMGPSKGLNASQVKAGRVRFGEGISGMAAQEGKSFFIGEKHSDNRISHLLRRPEIQESFVMPLKAKDRILGVLNVHTKKEGHGIRENVGNLQILSALVSAAI